MASVGCVQPEPGIPPEHQDKASDKLLFPAPAKGSAPAGSAGAKETAKEGANFHAPGLLSVYPHPSPLPGQSSPLTPLPNPQRVTQAFCRKEPALWPAGSPRHSDHPGLQGCAGAHPHKRAQEFAADGSHR